MAANFLHSTATCFTVWCSLHPSQSGGFAGLCIKGLNATNEWQDDGTGVLHQVAQFPIDQVCLYKSEHASL